MEMKRTAVQGQSRQKVSKSHLNKKAENGGMYL
jgi:hypothetical protein